MKRSWKQTAGIRQLGFREAQAHMSTVPSSPWTLLGLSGGHQKCGEREWAPVARLLAFPEFRSKVALRVLTVLGEILDTQGHVLTEATVCLVGEMPRALCTQTARFVVDLFSGQSFLSGQRENALFFHPSSNPSPAGCVRKEGVTLGTAGHHKQVSVNRPMLPVHEEIVGREERAGY